jgi:hypothetical protein
LRYATESDKWQKRRVSATYTIKKVSKPHEEGKVTTPPESEPSSSSKEENESELPKADSSTDANSSTRHRNVDEDLLIYQPHAPASVKVSDEYLEYFSKNCVHAMKIAAMHGEEKCGHIPLHELRFIAQANVVAVEIWRYAMVDMPMSRSLTCKRGWNA